MGAVFEASHPKEDVDIKNVKPIWRTKPDEALKAVQAGVMETYGDHGFWMAMVTMVHCSQSKASHSNVMALPNQPLWRLARITFSMP